LSIGPCIAYGPNQLRNGRPAKTGIRSPVSGSVHQVLQVWIVDGRISNEWVCSLAIGQYERDSEVAGSIAPTPAGKTLS
jgi:hypothetical protein